LAALSTGAATNHQTPSAVSSIRSSAGLHCEEEIIIGLDAETERVSAWSDKAAEILGVPRVDACLVGGEGGFALEDLFPGMEQRGWGLKEALDVVLLRRPRWLATEAVKKLCEQDIKDLQAFVQGHVPPCAQTTMQAVSILLQGRKDKAPWKALMNPGKLLEGLQAMEAETRADPQRLRMLDQMLDESGVASQHQDRVMNPRHEEPEPTALERLCAWYRAMRDAARDKVASVEASLTIRGKQRDVRLTVMTRRAQDGRVLGAMMAVQELGARQAEARKLISHKGLIPGGELHALDHSAGSRALIHAVCTAHLADVKLLLDASCCSIDKADGQGLTALTYAIMYGSQDIAQELLTRGASLDTLTHNGQSLIHIASRFGRGKMLGVISSEILRRCGGNEDAARADFERLVLVQTAPGGISCLHLAARHGHPQTAQALADACRRLLLLQVEVDREEKRGYNPLHVAVERGDEQVAKGLLAAAARANCAHMLLRQASSSGHTAGELASSREQAGIASFLGEKLAGFEKKAALMRLWLQKLEAGSKGACTFRAHAVALQSLRDAQDHS
jgi:hypothetical protein